MKTWSSACGCGSTVCSSVRPCCSRPLPLPAERPNPLEAGSDLRAARPAIARRLATEDGRPVTWRGVRNWQAGSAAPEPAIEGRRARWVVVAGERSGGSSEAFGTGTSCCEVAHDDSPQATMAGCGTADPRSSNVRSPEVTPGGSRTVDRSVVRSQRGSGVRPPGCGASGWHGALRSVTVCGSSRSVAGAGGCSTWAVSHTMSADGVAAVAPRAFGLGRRPV